MTLSPALQTLIKGAKNKYSRNTGNSVKLKEGKTRLRIVSGNPGGQFWADVGVHWIKPDKNAKPVAVVGCHFHTYDKPCPTCTAIEKASKASPDDESLAIIKDWGGKKSVLVAAVHRTGPDANEDDAQITELTPTTFGQMLSIMEEYGDIVDPETGIDLIVERRGKGLDTEYTVMPAPKSEPVKKAVLSKIPDLAEFIERQYFRGEEPKALNAIAQITGVSVTGVLAGAAKAGLLTKPVDDFNVEAVKPSKPAVAEAPAPAAKVEAPTATEEPADEFGSELPESELDDLLGELDDLG